MSVKAFRGCLVRPRGSEGGFGLQLFKEASFNVSSISQITGACLLHPLRLIFCFFVSTSRTPNLYLIRLALSCWCNNSKKHFFECVSDTTSSASCSGLVYVKPELGMSHKPWTAKRAASAVKLEAVKRENPSVSFHSCLISCLKDLWLTMDAH